MRAASKGDGGKGAATMEGAVTKAITRALEAHVAKVASAKLVTLGGLTTQQAGPGLQAYLATLHTRAQSPRKSHYSLP